MEWKDSFEQFSQFFSLFQDNLFHFMKQQIQMKILEKSKTKKSPANNAKLGLEMI